MFIGERIKSRLNLTRDTLVKMYNEQKAQFTTPERRTMRLIDMPYRAFLGSAAAPNAADWTEARRKAQETMARAAQALADGDDFTAVAMQYSKGVNAASGGGWRPITRGALKASYAPVTDALFTLPEGGTSEVLSNDEGLFLVRCEKIDAKQEVSFADAQSLIRDELIEKERRAAYQSLTMRLRADAQIDMSEAARFLRAVAEAAPKHKSETASVTP
jgi:hypothetical protein